MSHAILCCSNAVGQQWGLGLDQHSPVVLIGWQLPFRPLNGGLPERVGSVLASALASVARVTFLTEEQDGGEVLVVRSGLWQRMRSLIAGDVPFSFSLASSCHAAEVRRLFYDLAYPWALQAQIALLSPRCADVPVVDYALLARLFSGNWLQASDAARTAGALAVLRPAVDGIALAVLPLSAAFRDTLLSALAESARNDGFEWLVLPESEFIARL